jgi:hypothetical protein
MIFMFLCTIWHGILSQLDVDNDTEGRVDLWGFVTFVIMYGVYHLVFITSVLIKVSKR